MFEVFGGMDTFLKTGWRAGTNTFFLYAVLIKSIPEGLPKKISGLGPASREDPLAVLTGQGLGAFRQSGEKK
ncbi:MAG: hypothetical protein HDQ94_04470, partial [Desulfovibrio sp.]|nr:hypothetical protein [Desulfovibrio sp.]